MICIERDEVIAIGAVLLVTHFVIGMICFMIGRTPSGGKDDRKKS